MSWLGILENIVADLVFILLAIIIGWTWLALTRRRKLQHFFGVTSSKRLSIFLSNLRVSTFGSIGISGREMSYQGSAVAYGEMQGANRIRDLFSFIVPSIAESSSILSKLLVADVHVQVLISPLEREELESEAPFIALGSPAYNIASEYLEDQVNSIVRFRFGTLRRKDLNTGEITIRPTAFSTDTEVFVSPGGTASIYSPQPRDDIVDDYAKEETSAILVNGIPPITDPTYGFVERIKDRNQDRMIFYVAGLSEHSTEGAAFYLASQWANLHKKYGAEKPFLVMLRFDYPDYGRWAKIFERELADE